MKYSKLAQALFKSYLDRLYNIKGKYKVYYSYLEKDLPYGTTYPASNTMPIEVQLYLNKSFPFMNYLTISHELAHVYAFLYDEIMHRYIHAIDIASKYYYDEFKQKIPYDEALSAISYYKSFWVQDKLPYFDLNKVREICIRYKI